MEAVLADVLDLTHSMGRFREAARHLWNSALLAQATWDVHGDFNEICATLFRAVIVRPVFGEGACEAAAAYGADPFSWLKVVPTLEHGTPIKINRTDPPGAYWDHAISRVKPSDVDLWFVDFFDFDNLGFREFDYVAVVIAAYEGHADLAGRPALLEPRHVRFVCQR